MSEQLYCGWARTDITPTVPVSLAGYFNIRIWDKAKSGLFRFSCIFQVLKPVFLLSGAP